ncbi:MAG: hypothetical protein Tsb0032_36370 [Kiloniellaceae bacterium]
MTKRAPDIVVEELPPQDDPKVRQCLRCRKSFDSQWAGERICTRCKNSNTWRSGLPVRGSGSGPHR